MGRSSFNGVFKRNAVAQVIECGYPVASAQHLGVRLVNPP